MELFRRADNLNQRLLERLAQVADHLRCREASAVIGALAGCEEDMASIRTLMLLAHDCFPSASTKENV